MLWKERYRTVIRKQKKTICKLFIVYTAEMKTSYPWGEKVGAPSIYRPL